MMSLGPYASFIVTSYAAAALVVAILILAPEGLAAFVAILIGWIVLDHRSQTQRLRELERSGVTRRSGRSATDQA